MQSTLKSNDRAEVKARALAALHDEIALFALRLREFAQAGRKVLLVRADDRLYGRVLQALRVFVTAGGKAFKDKRFADFFQEIEKIASQPAKHVPANLKSLISAAEKNEKAKYQDPREQAKEFAKTAVRISGGEWRADVEGSLVNLSKTRANKRKG